jgi:hypothetical protein
MGTCCSTLPHSSAYVAEYFKIGSSKFYEHSTADFFSQFRDGVRLDVFPNLPDEGEKRVVLITAFWYAFLRTIPSFLTLDSNPLKKDVLITDAILFLNKFKRNEDKTDSSLKPRDIPTTYLLNFLVSLKQKYGNKLMLTSFRTVNGLKPSFCTAFDQSIMFDVGSGAIKAVDCNTGTLISDEYVLEIPDIDKVTTTSVRSYANIINDYVDTHFSHIVKNKIPIRCTGKWRNIQNIDKCKEFFNRLNLHGFNNCSILTQEDEGKMEGISAVKMSNPPVGSTTIVVAGGSGSVQIPTFGCYDETQMKAGRINSSRIIV